MDIIDRVYIASAIDGEGWISLLKSKGSRCLLGYRFKPEVGISNTNEE
ncbi:MAG: hypothetical protein H3Z52_15050, partial [archaeon]|nr:hypothetical protein [archaeon]